MELMKPPRRVKVEASAAAKPPTLSDPAIEVGRLVALLRGEGLTESTLLELLRLENVAKLRGVLTDSPFAKREDQDPGPVSPENGQLLVFKTKEAVKP
jgi:hypothetical protein